MVQVPPVVLMMAVVSETVQTEDVVEAKLTVRLEEAVAESVNCVPPYWGPGLSKLMVCALALTVKLRVTGVAAA
jgi:hypothetical protein